MLTVCLRALRHAGAGPWLALFGFLAACSGSELPAPRFELKPVAEKADPGPDRVTVPAGALGPYLVQHEGGALMVWAAAPDGHTQWFTRPTDSLGQPKELPVQVAQAEAPASSIVVRSFAGGVLGLSTSQTDSEGSIDIVVFERDGSLRTSPSSAVRTSRQLLWVDVVSFEQGGLLVWAAREGAAAALYSLSINGFGQGQGEVHPLHAGVSGWQVRRFGESAVVAVVTPAGELEFLTLDGDGRPLVENAVPTAAGVEPELDLVDLGGEMLAAFSAVHRGGRQVFTLRLGPDGGPVGTPVLAVPEWGEQRPVQLVRGNDSTSFLAWRSDEQFPGTLLVAPLNRQGIVVGVPGQIPLSDTQTVPALAAWSGGLLALVNRCDAGRQAASCGQTASEAWFFSADLQQRIAQPLAVGRAPAELAWNPTCNSQGCLGLTATLGGDPIVSAQALFPPDGAQSVRAAPPQAGLLFEQLRTPVAPPEPLAAFALVGDAGETLVTLSDFDPSAPYRIPEQPAPDGRKAPVRAVLSVYGGLAADGAASPREVLSYRARSVSGISVSHATDETLVVWSALDPKAPQVFLSLLDSKGKKRRQSMLTHSPGEVFAVGSAKGPDDKWFVAWVDERSGAPRAHLALVSRQLDRLTRELPVAESAVVAPYVIELRVTGAELWVLIAGRVAEAGEYVVGLQRFARIGLTPLGDFEALARSKSKIESVAFAAGSTPAAGWVRDGRAEVAGLGLDGRALFLRSWLGADGLTYAAATCDGTCRLVAVARQGPGSIFYAAQLSGEETSVPRVVVRSADLAAAAFRPVLTPRGDLWFYDTDRGSRPRVNQARLKWSDGAE